MVSLILDGIAGLLGGLFDALPTWVPPDVDGVNTLGGFLRTIDYFVPIAGPVAFSAGLLAMLPAFLALKFGLMVYSLTRGGGPS